MSDRAQCQLGNTAKRVHAYIAANPGKTGKEMAFATGLQQRTVRNMLAMLLKNGLVRRNAEFGGKYWLTGKPFPEITHRGRPSQRDADWWPKADQSIHGAFRAMVLSGRSHA